MISERFFLVTRLKKEMLRAMKKVSIFLIVCTAFAIIIGTIANKTSNEPTTGSTNGNTATGNTVSDETTVESTDSNTTKGNTTADKPTAEPTGSKTTANKPTAEPTGSSKTTAHQQPTNTQDSTLVAEGAWTDTVFWRIDRNGTMFVTGSGAIPDYEKGATNKPWGKYQKKITTLVVEEGITRIGDRAFQTFRHLERAVIGKDVTSIGDWAFQNCYGLKDVEISRSVKLGIGAFLSAPVEWEIHGAPSDIYANSEYYTAWRNVKLTGNYRDDIINIALSQVGYKEGNNENELAGDVSGSGNYTEYGRSLSTLGSAWCSEFASWCIRNANVPASIIVSSNAANADAFTGNSSADFYTWDSTTFGGGKYLPQKGDLILWSWDGEMHETDENLSHTSILWEISTLENGDVLIKTIDGNSNNQVRVREYTVSSTSGQLVSKTGLVCYIIAPHYDG